MATSTISVLQTLEFCKRFIFLRPTTNGNFLEPAVTSANTIMQTIMGPPFTWPWNRVVTGFVCVVGQQDYKIFNWAASTAVQVGYVLVDSNGNSQMVTTAGTTNASIPTFNNNKNGTTTDGTAIWANNGPIGVLNTSPTYNFGWVETVSVKATDNQGKPGWKQIANKLYLELESAQSRPDNIAAQFYGQDGNVTFRLMPAPDKPYPVAITLQQRPTLVTGTEGTWAPIPDEYSRIYNWGMLALLFLFADDPRFQQANQKFITNLLSTSQGLTQTQLNIMLNNWQAIIGQPITNVDALQQGFQGRGNL